MYWQLKLPRFALLLPPTLLLVGCGDDDSPTGTNGGDTPRTWVIAPDGSGDAANIQSAVDAAEAGDVILLEDGTYTGDGNRDIDLNGKNLTVKSRSSDPETCIIDCEGTSSVAHRGFYLHSGETSVSVIEDLNATNGNQTPGVACAWTERALRSGTAGSFITKPKTEAVFPFFRDRTPR